MYMYIAYVAARVLAKFFLVSLSVKATIEYFCKTQNYRYSVNCQNFILYISTSSNDNYFVLNPFIARNLNHGLQVVLFPGSQDKRSVHIECMWEKYMDIPLNPAFLLLLHKILKM